MTIATTTPTANAVPKADGSGKLADGWLPDEVPLTDEVNSFTKAQRGTVVTLTDAATVAVDLSLANNYTLTLGGNRTLGAPSNAVAGQGGVIEIKQDGGGNRTLAYNAAWKFPAGTAPTLSTAANARDLLVYQVIDSSTILAQLIKAFA
jgi:hypothetical protein